MGKKLCVFQHIDIEHPGIFRDFLAADGHDYDAIELDTGDRIPDLSAYDGLWVMGGPMDVWQEQEHPWLVEEKAAIRHAVVDLEIPYLGFCLGHQLLAEALGGRVGLSVNPEIGILDVNTTSDSPFLTNVPTTIPCLQWHSAEVQSAPATCQVLMSSPDCDIQALSYGNHAFSVQFHVELTDATVPEWGCVPEYAAALEKSLGVDAITAFEQSASDHMPQFNELSRTLYRNWCKTTGFSS